MLNFFQRLPQPSPQTPGSLCLALVSALFVGMWAYAVHAGIDVVVCPDATFRLWVGCLATVELARVATLVVALLSSLIKAHTEEITAVASVLSLGALTIALVPVVCVGLYIAWIGTAAEPKPGTAEEFACREGGAKGPHLAYASVAVLALYTALFRRGRGEASSESSNEGTKLWGNEIYNTNA